MCVCVVWSQYNISGSILDSNKNPIAFANVIVIKSQDSTFVNGASSNDFGQFKIEEIPSGDFILKASYIGFQDYFLSFSVHSDVTLEDIILVESVESLSEVEVVYNKPTIKREVDKLVFNVENTSLSEGNMLEVLKSTPSVLVIDDALMVKGDSPTVYINDRKVNLSSSELLELLEGTSASNIKSVQVITNPSARYDAESGVVLNILMSKNLSTGYNGNLFTNYTQGVFPKWNFGTSHYFKNSKVDVFVNYSYNKNKINRDSEEFIFYQTEEWNTNLNRNTRLETHNIGLNLDFKLNEKSTLAFAANTQFLPYFKYQTKGKATIAGNSDFDEIYSNNLSKDNKHNLGFDLEYSYDISKNSNLTWNSHYTNYDYDRDQNVKSIYFNSDAYYDNTAFKTNAHQETDILTSQIDFSTTLSESSSLETGVKISKINTGSAINQYDIIAGISQFNSFNSDNFVYNENIYAGYISYEYSSEEWNFTAGIRVEQTNLDNVSLNQTENTQDYFELFPTTNLSYQFSEKVNSYVTYKRSIQRPNYSNLNPFKFYLNDYTIVTGNPELKPVFNNHFLLGTTINDKFTFEVYYRSYKNNIFELPLQNNNNNTVTYTPLNIDETVEIGIDFETYFNVTENWFLYFGTSTYNFNDKGTLFDTKVQRDKWANYSILSNDFTFLKDKSLVANLSFIYVGKNVQGLQQVDSRLLSDLSVKKNILKGKGVLSIAVSDFFNDHDFKVTTDFLDQNSTLFSNLDNRYIKLGFRYKFGNSKLSTNQRSTSRDERIRLDQKNH
ncbi:MAG: TonB-dependent receptor [Bacteroidia bacterium]|nr:TonB-dependent receptor [Bacteroidia bacterium]